MDGGEGVTLFNPSTFQNLAENDDDQDEEEDQRHIEQQIEERLADMDGEEINLEDDEDDSIYHPHQHQIQHQNQQHQQQNTNPGFQAQGQFSPSPFSFGIGVPPGHQSSSGRVNFNQVDERNYLLNGQDKGQENIEILYQARGEEIKRLNAELDELSSAKENEIRQLRHDLTILKADKGRLEANLEHLESVAQGQSDENRELRRELEVNQNKLMSSEDMKSNIVTQLESSELVVKTLQSQLSDLQKSDTILKAKQHHEQVVRSLKERHETETYNMQQEYDRLNLKLKHLENEVDASRSKCSKIQRDHELLMIEKSETIKELQERLEATQKRLAQNISETSSQGYVNIKAMHERFKMDQEKYANDLLTYQSELDELRASLKRKDEEIISLRRAVNKSKLEQEQISTQKSETISNLQQRLLESEKRLNKLIEETSRNAGLTGLTDKLKQDTRKLTAELEKAHLDIQDREIEIASMSSKVCESIEKYQNLKKKVRQYQLHCKSKEMKYNERLRNSEEDYKTKLLALRDKMEEGYSSKEKQVEKQVLEMKHFFDQELNKLMELDQNPVRLLPEHRQQHFEDLENCGPAAQKPTVPMPGLSARPVSVSSASEELARLFENAKLDLKDQLKMPTERFPFTAMNGN